MTNSYLKSRFSKMIECVLDLPNVTRWQGLFLLTFGEVRMIRYFKNTTHGCHTSDDVKCSMNNYSWKFLSFWFSSFYINILINFFLFSLKIVIVLCRAHLTDTSWTYRIGSLGIPNRRICCMKTIWQPRAGCYHVTVLGKSYWFLLTLRMQSYDKAGSVW